METVNITIPDNLTPEQEVFAIAKSFGKRAIQGSSKKAIGDVLTIKHLQTQIIVTREAVEKPIITRTCSVCNTIFEQSIGSTLFTNYGGLVRKQFYCSDECRKAVIDIFGDRCAIKKKDIQIARLF